MVLPDVLVGPCLQLGHLLRSERYIQINGDHVAAHVEAHIVTAVEAVGDAGDDVLSRVMLHEIKAAGPVDLPLHLAACLQWSGAGVDDPSLTLVDLQHRYTSQRAGVIGLSAALGVKGGLVQENIPPLFALGTGLHRGRKMGEVGLCFIELFHG